MSNHLNVEIKAKCQDPEKIHAILKNEHADYKGEDHQIDTYFDCPKGRLKLREGNIENTLIFYERNNQAGPKDSLVKLDHLQPGHNLKSILEQAYGKKCVVDKKRHIYFINNVKFHVDEVQGLGSFVEIEAIDSDNSIGQAKLEDQCRHFMGLFGVKEDDLIDCSYSDMIH